MNWDSFKWRNYDYAIGRFMSIDPLAEEYTYNSPYAFQENKMGLGRELEGLELEFFNWIVATSVSKEAENQMENIGMNDKEKAIARANIYQMYQLKRSDNKGKAERFSEKSGLSGLHNGDGDAFRHGLFNALNVQTVGRELTNELAVAHEEGDGNQPQNEKIMDALNNKTGMVIGENNPDASIFELASMILDKMEDGEMIKLDSNGNLTKTKLTPEKKQEVLENLQNLDKNGNQDKY